MNKEKNEKLITINITQNIFNIIDARIIRKAVFVNELNCKDEFDTFDTASFHIVIYMDCKPVGTARMFCYDDDIYAIERLCVINEFRNIGIGRKLLSECENFLSTFYSGIVRVVCDLAHCEYFEKLGYTRNGFPFNTSRGVMVNMQKDK